MRGSIAGTIVLLVGLGLPLAAQGRAEKPRVAVVNIAVDKGVSPQLADPFAEFVAEAIRNLGKYQVLAKSDLPKTKAYPEIAGKMECSDLACLADIGRKLGVDMVVFGKMSRVANGFLLDLQLVDTHMWRIAAGISDTVLGGNEVEGVVQQLFKLAFDLPEVLGKRGKAALGTGGVVDVNFEANVPGAELTLDGKNMGALPVEQRLAPGQHPVVVKAGGYLVLSQVVMVQRGYTRQTVHLELVPDPVRELVTQNLWISLAASGGNYGGGLEISLFLKRWEYFYWDIVRLGGEARGAQYNTVRLGTAFGFPWHIDGAGLHELRIGIGAYGTMFQQRERKVNNTGTLYTYDCGTVCDPPADQDYVQDNSRVPSRSIKPVDVFYGFALAPELTYSWLVWPKKGIALLLGFRAYITIKDAGAGLTYPVEGDREISTSDEMVWNKVEYNELGHKHPQAAFSAFLGFRI